jgi:hypothetical protein
VHVGSAAATHVKQQRSTSNNGRQQPDSNSSPQQLFAQTLQLACCLQATLALYERADGMLPVMFAINHAVTCY